jgi:hypothetical protein
MGMDLHAFGAWLFAHDADRECADFRPGAMEERHHRPIRTQLLHLLLGRLQLGLPWYLLQGFMFHRHLRRSCLLGEPPHRLARDRDPRQEGQLLWHLLEGQDGPQAHDALMDKGREAAPEES